MYHGLGLPREPGVIGTAHLNGRAGYKVCLLLSAPGAWRRHQGESGRSVSVAASAAAAATAEERGGTWTSTSSSCTTGLNSAEQSSSPAPSPSPAPPASSPSPLGAASAEAPPKPGDPATSHPGAPLNAFRADRSAWRSVLRQPVIGAAERRSVDSGSVRGTVRRPCSSVCALTCLSGSK